MCGCILSRYTFKHTFIKNKCEGYEVALEGHKIIQDRAVLGNFGVESAEAGMDGNRYQFG